MMDRSTSGAWAGMVLVFLTGCATTGGRGPERIAVDSAPAGSDVRIECDAVLTGSGVTPTSIMVPRTADHCVVTISHDGYQSQQVPLERGINRLYWGNIALVAGVPLALLLNASENDEGEALAKAVVGALGGMALGGAGLIIDSVTDAKRDHDPKTISVTLKARPFHPVVRHRTAPSLAARVKVCPDRRTNE